MTAQKEWKNQLYFGDNLGILRDHIASESVDLVYLDPPFNSNASYNVLFGEKGGEKSSAQITAFDDTWHWGIESEAAFKELVEQAPAKLVDLMRALRSFLGQSDMMAYLTMMAVRLVELHRVLKPTGSLYLHCDPTASHYLRMLLDGVFGPESFMNEVIWKRTHAHGGAKRYGPVHDVIHFYKKSGNYIWNPQQVEYSEKYVDSFFTFTEADGRRYRLTILTGSGTRGGSSGLPWKGYDPTKIGRHWAIPGYVRCLLRNPEAKTAQEALDQLEEIGRVVWAKKSDGAPSFKQYLDDMKGSDIQDIWADIPPVSSQARERLGYPTQKPEALLERIIKASSNEGDLVLDPFCGCGTTVVAAERLKRRWIGIDITHLAINLMQVRLRDSFGYVLSPFVVEGVPKDLESARALAQQVDRHHFEWWALSLVGARPAQDKKKGADTGIDGVLYFTDDESGNPKKGVVQVKSGSVKSGDIRDFKSVIEREKAALGLFLTLEDPSAPMTKEAATAGFYEPEHFQGRGVPKVQILTIEALLSGHRPELPRFAPAATFKQAPRKKSDDKQGRLF